MRQPSTRNSGALNSSMVGELTVRVGSKSMAGNSFSARAELRTADGRDLGIYRLDALGSPVERLPYSLKILLENLLRHEDGVTVRPEDVDALAGWDPDAEPSREIAFAPARILMQDFTGV